MSVQIDGSDVMRMEVGAVTVEAVLGNIVNETTDAIVNSTNDVLDLCGEIGGDGILAVSAGVTTLKCKYLIHVNKRKRVKNLVQSCLKEADRLTLRSISLPKLGAGRGGKDPDKIICAMLTGVQQFLYNDIPAHLRLVRFVVSEQKLMNAFKRTMTLVLDPGALCINVGDVSIEILLGNIVNETSDAIVCSTNDVVDLTGKIGADGVVAVSAEGTTLKCKYKIHIDIGKPARKLVKNCFKEADRLKLQSISLPALGTGNNPEDSKEILRGMLSGVREYLSDSTPVHLRKIRFIAFQPRVMILFKKAMVKALCGERAHRKLFTQITRISDLKTDSSTASSSESDESSSTSSSDSDESSSTSSSDSDESSSTSSSDSDESSSTSSSDSVESSSASRRGKASTEPQGPSARFPVDLRKGGAGSEEESVAPSSFKSTPRDGLRWGVLPLRSQQVHSIQDFWKVVHVAQHIVIQELVTHHALIESYCAQKSSVRVIHRRPGGVIKEKYIQKIISAINEKRLFIVPYRHNITEGGQKKAIQRARSKLGCKKYNLIFNNCEHFVNWCLYDVHFAEQVLLYLPNMLLGMPRS